MICAHCCFKAVFLLHIIPISIRSWNKHPYFIVNTLCFLTVFTDVSSYVIALIKQLGKSCLWYCFAARELKSVIFVWTLQTVQVNMSRWIFWFHLHNTMCLKTQCTTVWIKIYCLQSANVIKMHHRTAIPLTTPSLLLMT
jgi:hypothetical protein